MIQKLILLHQWYSVLPTVHEVLFHSSQVIAHAILPTGQLKQEAQEARNRDVKRLRQYNWRKLSRIENIEDIFHGLPVSSKAYISTLKKKLKA